MPFKGYAKLIHLKTAEAAFKLFAVSSIVSVIVREGNASGQTPFAPVFITFALLLNDLARSRYLAKEKKALPFRLSVAGSVMLAAFLLNTAYGIGSEIYITLLLIEIMMMDETIPADLLTLHFFAFFLALKDGGTGNGEILASYGIIFVIIYLFRNLSMEKANYQKLLQERNAANEKLTAYSAKIQELTIHKERSRISQELHDSLGHYLVALHQNLEFAENAFDRNPSEALHAIENARRLSKESMAELRKTVHLVSNPLTSRGLRQ